MGDKDTLHGTSSAIAAKCPRESHTYRSLFPQTQPREEGRYKHTLDAALTIYRTEGWSAFFRGLLPSLLGITHVAVQFPLYEHLKRIACESLSSALPLSPHVFPERRAHNLLPSSARRRTEPLQAEQILVCSAIAKMTASIVTYPHEVVRTRLQTERRPLSMSGLDGSDSTVKPPKGGIIRTTKHIIAHEGWRALYRGLSVNLVRTVPNSAVTMLT